MGAIDKRDQVPIKERERSWESARNLRASSPLWMMADTQASATVAEQGDSFTIGSQFLPLFDQKPKAVCRSPVNAVSGIVTLIGADRPRRVG